MEFPILCVHYDEHVLDEKALFGKVTQSSFYCSSSLKAVFYHYYDLLCRRSGTVTIIYWILHFVNMRYAFEVGFPSPGDPFGVV